MSPSPSGRTQHPDEGFETSFTPPRVAGGAPRIGVPDAGALEPAAHWPVALVQRVWLTLLLFTCGAATP